MEARAQASRIVGIAAGLLIAALLAAGPLLGAFGRGLMLAPFVFGVVVVVAVAVGETMKPRFDGPRTASLQPRRARDYLPRWALPTLGALAATLVGTLVLTTVTASEDETLGGFRALACRAGNVGSAVGPYPGAYYSVPLAVGLLLLALGLGVAARQVVLRPRGVAGPGEDDDDLRRRSMLVLAAGGVVALGTTLAGIAIVAGGALLRLDHCAAAWMAPAGWALLVVGALAGMAAVAGAVVLLTGGSRR